MTHHIFKNTFKIKIGGRWISVPKNKYTDGGKGFKKDPPCGKKEVFDTIMSDIDKFVHDIARNDTPEARAAMLRTDRLRYYYCKRVNDRQEVFLQLTDPWWCVSYCRWVRCREEVYDKIPEGSRPRRYLNNWLKRSGTEPKWLKKRHMESLTLKKKKKKKAA